MNRTSMSSHISNARIIEKKNIYGMYLISIILSLFGGAIAIIEYSHFLLSFLIVGFILLSLVFSIIFLKNSNYSLYSKFIGIGLSYLWMLLSFNYVILYYLATEYANTDFSIWFVIRTELVVAILMVLFMFRNINKGLKTWQHILILLSGGVVPLLIILLFRFSSLAESISNEVAILMTPFILGLLCYPVFDNFCKAYYLKKLDLK